MGNQATSGGGTFNGYLNNCTVVDNHAAYMGGGAYDSRGANSILVNNYDYPSFIQDNYSPESELRFSCSYCCTSLSPYGVTSGTGNIDCQSTISGLVPHLHQFTLSWYRQYRLRLGN